MAEAKSRVIAVHKKAFTPLLSKKRTWYDDAGLEVIQGEGTEVTTPVVEPVVPPVPGKVVERQEPNMVDVDALDDQGHRKYFEKTYVTDLREENRTSRQARETAENKLAALEQAGAVDKAAKLTENEEFQELAETYRLELETLRGQYAQAEFANMQSVIGSEYNLPPEISKRLQGKNREELVTDAQALAAVFVKSKTQQESQGITPVPDGSPPPARDDASRRGEYFSGANADPDVFRFDPDNLRFHGKD